MTSQPPGAPACSARRYPWTAGARADTDPPGYVPRVAEVLWYRRDLRLLDHPALLAAAGGGRGVLPLFVLDPALWEPAGPPRQAWLVRSLRALAASADGALVVRHGDPARVVPEVAAAAGADAVHVTADAGPYGRRRDDGVARALAADGRRLVRTGTPYAVGPGTLLSGARSPYQVFTPFARAWARHGWPAPAATPPKGLRWARGVDSEAPPDEPDLDGVTLPGTGEAAALARWTAFEEERLTAYAEDRERPGLDGTSGLSAHLKFGEVHPRTLLAGLARHRSRGADAFRTELCWREFYADVLWHRPDSAREYLRPELAALRYDDPGPALAAWQQGRTGFPIVDAGMRQLRAEGWMHNRVRMIVASFLVKDLHVEWRHGARWFMRRLRDGDLASNQHGWQWAAGSGTDAAPYVRVFNPLTQGRRYDPDGAYVRRHVPELRHLAGGDAHEPWAVPDGYVHGYPERIVDHAQERREALARFEELRGKR
jgi:deoxyribodipyrimidine photo-lyase